MKKLFVLSVLALAACSESRGVHGDWSSGAEFGPSSVAEFRARAARGEPGVFPAPSGYSVYASKQVSTQTGTRVIQQGTASSRTGEFITNGALTVAQARGTKPVKVAAAAAQPSVSSSAALRSSPYRKGALRAAGRITAWGADKVSIDGNSLRTKTVNVKGTPYAVFVRSGVFGAPLPESLGPSMQAALPSLTGCSNAAGPFLIGPGGRTNTHMVFALNC